MFSPEQSPDGTALAVFWNRQPKRGVYVVDLAANRERLVRETPRPGGPSPLGWSPDGTIIFGYEGKRAAYRGLSVPLEETLTEARIVGIPVNGEPLRTIVQLPFEEVGSVAMFPDGRRFVVSVYSARSDVWIVEHFDSSSESRLARQ